MSNNISLTLHFGADRPAPSWMTAAIDSVTVSQSDTVPNGFQISFLMERSSNHVSDFQLLTSSYLQAGARIMLSVTMNGVAQVLIDGYITHIQSMPATLSQNGQLLITGEDVSIQMNLYEYSLEYPFMGDAAIALAVLAKWTLLGIVPEVWPTPSSVLSFEHVPQQVGTDRDYLQQLAQSHGYVFYIHPGPVLGLNMAYWGPPPRMRAPQRTLSVDSGTATNVEQLQFAFDATAPQITYGMVLQTETNTILPVLTPFSTRLPLLAARPALDADLPFVRTALFDHQGYGIVRAYARAQAITNTSTDQVVVAQGTLDALRYGDILTAPGVVGVRGAGASFDGYYYVKKVTHDISRGKYTQDFTLTREGLQTTVASLPGI